MADGEYEKTPRSSVNRLAKRGRYDYETIHAIINHCPILHVSFNPPKPDDDPFPTILPMLGCTSSTTEHEEPVRSETHPGSFPTDDNVEDYNDGPRHIYLHGYVSSRFMKLPSSSNDGDAKRVPVCVAASFMDGLVLALTPFHNSCNYRSAVVHGWASVVEDDKERMYAIQLITDNMLLYRWNNSRIPPTKAEMQSTGVIKVEIESASAKVREGGPGDDRHDLKDASVVGNVWTGVVPSYLQYGEPVSSEYNQVKKVPGYISTWVEEQNLRNKAVAHSAIQEMLNKKTRG